MLLLAYLFEKYFIPMFGITTRFVGTEPLSPMTEQYNEALRKNLSIPLREIPRKESDNAPISASKVRTLVEQGQFDHLKTLVPPSTFQYLMKYNKEI